MDTARNSSLTGLKLEAMSGVRSLSTRYRVLLLYKELLYIGKDYPAPYDQFRKKLKLAFEKNKSLDADEDINKAISFGEYMKKELVALYQLRVYRAVKRNYYS